MRKKPFAAWLIAASLVYVGLGLTVISIIAALTGTADVTLPFTLPFIVVFAVAITGVVIERRWGLYVSALSTVAFLAILLPFTVEELGNPANPLFSLLISGFPIAGLVLVFSVLGLRARGGMARVPYLATPKSSGGLLAVGVLGFAIGAILIGSIAGGIIAPIVSQLEADVRIVRGADNPQVAEPFSPRTLTISAGQTVTWVNADAVIHTVTNETGLFGSPSLRPGDRFSHTFDTPGTYGYFCIPHSYMQGTIVVTRP